MKKLFQKSEFRIACYLLLLIGVFGSIMGASFEQFMDKYVIAPKTGDARAYGVANGERALVIQYVGSSAYAAVVTTKTVYGKEYYSFYEAGTIDSSVGTTGYIYSTMTVTDTMGEFVSVLDADVNWVCKLVDARKGENSNLIEGLSSRYQTDGTALAHADGTGTCYSTNTVTFVDATGNGETLASAFDVYYDTGQLNGSTNVGTATENNIRWGQSPSSGKRIVITGITSKLDLTATGTIEIWFDNVLREVITIADNTLEYWHTPGVKGQERWAPVDARVTIRVKGDKAAVAGNILLVNWYQL